jgi:hypothetical protein
MNIENKTTRSYRLRLTRAEHLAEIESMPDKVYLNPEQAAAFLNTSMQTLANWRSKRTGPQYVGRGRFIRYPLNLLKAFVNERANEVDAYIPVTADQIADKQDQTANRVRNHPANVAAVTQATSTFKQFEAGVEESAAPPLPRDPLLGAA